ncbi:MAG: hypothetical protein WED15_04285 [Akkermansiaceae bacterium]
MKNLPVRRRQSRFHRMTGTLNVMVAAAFAALAPFAQADLPDRAPGELRGLYKVAGSNDPIFPVTANQEWFLDFGEGITSKKMSGNVAVSLRENPSVRVRIMAWQFFPDKGNLLIGNPFHEGSSQAVARGNWQLRTTSSGAVFKRGPYQVVLHKADPADG